MGLNIGGIHMPDEFWARFSINNLKEFPVSADRQLFPRRWS